MPLRVAPRLLSLTKPLCLLCGQWLPRGPVTLALCRFCADTLPWNSAACRRCALPVASCSEANRCASWSVTETLCALRYETPVSAWVLRSKRANGFPETRLLGALLAAAVIDAGADRGVDALVPVPLALPRLVYRGFNQAALLATEIRRHTGTPVLRSGITRQRHTALQPGLSRAARRRNLANAFRVRRDLAGLHLAIVDDVMTSGATALSLTHALEAAGARRVDVWCAARAQPS